MSGTVDLALYQALVHQIDNITPTKFLNVKATASGNTPIWVPATGKKFVLLSYSIDFTSNVSQAVAGLIDATFIDGATNTQIGISVFVPNAAGTVFSDSGEGFVSLGGGYPSVAANNILSINLSAALATGVCHVMVFGREI
jgi:hypothetical protein